jgi:hypothetical protein
MAPGQAYWINVPSSQTVVLNNEERNSAADWT